MSRAGAALGWIVLGATLGCSASDDPAARVRSEPPSPTRSVPSTAGSVESVGEIHGLPLPRGSEHTASDGLGDDYIVPLDPDVVREFVAANVRDGTRSDRPPGISEFRRVVPTAPGFEDVRLYVLVMGYPGRGTSLRVQRLPATATTPEQLRENVERFRQEVESLD